MNKPNTEIYLWGIVVIQPLYPNDVKTGEILFHDVLQYKEYHKKESFSSFYDVNSSDEFRLAVQTIEESLSFDETFNLKRNISSLVDNQLEQLNIPITGSTRAIMAYYIQQLLENLHNRFYNYYNFKDFY